MVMVGMVTISRCATVHVTCGICLYPKGRGANQDVHPSGHSALSRCYVALKTLERPDVRLTLWEDTRHLCNHTQPHIISKDTRSLGTHGVTQLMCLLLSKAILILTPQNKTDRNTSP